MRYPKQVFGAVATALVLMLIFTLALDAQSQQRIANLLSQRITVTNDLESRGTATFAQATITNLTAPTVTMSSATTWTVSSLTADVALTAEDFTAGSAEITTATIGSLTADTFDGDLTVNGNAIVTGTARVDGATDIGGALTVTGTTALLGNVDVTGNLETVDHIGTSAELYLFSGDALAVTDGQVITPTESLLELTATGEVTASLETAVDGQVLILANSSNSTINIADSGTTRLSAAAALGQYDTLTLIGLGTSWYEIARSTN